MWRGLGALGGCVLPAVVLGAGGCHWIIGLDEFVDAPAAGAGGGGSGGSGGGGAGVCEPGASESCYGGPEGTEGVGSCAAGTRSCLEDGSGWGECVGEVRPGGESCAETADEDCDGFDCGIWANFYEESEGAGVAVATNANGDVFVTGYFSGTLQLGETPLISSGGQDIFVASFDAAGNHRWSKQFSDAANQSGVDIAVDHEGNIILLAINSGTINMGGGNLGPGFIVAKLAQNGSHVWSVALGGTTGQGFDERPRLAVTPANDVIFAASFGGTMAFDDGSLTATSSGDDIAVAKLRGTNGSTSQAAGGWARMFGAPGADVVGAASVDIAGNILVAGRHADGTSFGGLPALQGSGMFLVKLDGNGNAAWSRSYSGAYPHGMQATPLGQVVVAGTYDDMADLGGGPLQGDPGGVFLAQLDSSGYHEWSWGVGGSTSLDVYALTRDAQGDIAVVGTFRNSIDFGAGPIDGTFDGPAIFVLKADGAGQPQWSRGFGGNLNDTGHDIAVTSGNDLVITGKSMGFLDFGMDQPGEWVGSSYPFLAMIGR